MLKPGDVVVVDFPGVTGIKRRPAVVVSSDAYHSARPDVIVGLITSQVAGSIGSTDHALADWSAAGLRLPSLFRSFLVTVPRTAVYHVAGHLSDQDWLAVRAKLGTAWLFDRRATRRGSLLGGSGAPGTPRLTPSIIGYGVPRTRALASSTTPCGRSVW